MKTSFILTILAATSSAKQAMTGVNIGGWQVLEPWITPSLFYRFLGRTQSEGVGMDQWSFCETLGPEEGNKVLKSHWKYWVTEDHVKALKDREVEIVRLPIGDWTLTPYGPYVGCTEGAADHIQWFLDVCAKYDMKVLLDMHSLVGSQNGFDNSGKGEKIVWSSETRYHHWETQAAYWMGDYDMKTKTYTSINQEHLDNSFQVASDIIDKWGQHPAVYAYEPVNEPWEHNPRKELSEFYVRVRNMMRDKAPHLIFLFHSAFDFSDSWNALFPDDDMENVVLDMHYYQAFDGYHHDTIQPYCDEYESGMAVAETIKYPVWNGEWSLGTDTCAMWLGGFNDIKLIPWAHTCAWVDCPKTYMPDEGVDFDRTAAEIGPFGSSKESGVKKGKCPIDSDFFGSDDMQVLGKCALKAFDNHTTAQFLWTFRNELEPKWDYIKAYDAGWLKRSSSEEEFLQ